MNDGRYTYNVGGIAFLIMAYAAMVFVTSIIGGGILFHSVFDLPVWVGGMAVCGVHLAAMFTVAVRLDQEDIMTQIDWLLSKGFNEEGYTYCIYGDDTYSIKDWLKQKGCKYDPVFKWHTAVPFELPVGFNTVKLHYKNFMDWDSYLNSMLYYEDAKAKYEEIIQRIKGPSTSVFFDGDAGERYTNITAIYKSHRGFMGNYGYTNIYTFEAEDAVLVWFTASTLDYEAGTAVNLDFTIKGFEVYRGVNTTLITRAKVTEIGEQYG